MAGIALRQPTGESVTVSMMSTLEKIGRYEIVSELGRGAMGLVYRAIDPNIGRTVALKTMRLDVHGMEHDDMLRRFRYEARAAGLMNHPNIVTIYDADEVDGLFYIAMEYLEGETLQSLMLEKRLFPADQIVEVGKQVATGLEYAHQMKVIHRDIKPANIMITRQNVAKIMDFGISKVAGNMTSGSQVLGTPNYMSPEQVRGLDLDGRADLFSFGVVLYEMATGERPFESDNITTIIYKIISQNPVPPADLHTGLHPGLSAVIMKCLAKTPDERYQSGAELARDLQNYRAVLSEGDITSKLPADSEIPVKPQPQMRGNGSANAAVAQSGGTQGTAVRTAWAAAPAEPATLPGNKTLVAPAAPAQTTSHHRRTSKIVVTILSLMVAAATLYEMRHRKHVEPPKPVQSNQQAQIGTPPASPVPPPQTEAANAQVAEAKPAVTRPSATPRPIEVANSVKPTVKKRAEPLPEKAPFTGKVEIRFTSNPPGAFVQVDGKSSSEWLTPFTMPNLTPGTHEVVFTKQGYSSETRKLEIGPKNDSYNLDLVPVTTALSITSDPPGASIEVDGRDTGKVTPAQIPVAEGDHKLVVYLDGYHNAQTLATVDRGQIFSFSPTLNPADARQAGNSNPVTTRLGKIFLGGIRGGKGMIDFVSNPPGARIFIQGRPMAFATPAHVPIPEGDYRIEFRESGYKPVEENVHVEAGKGIRVAVTLEPQQQ